MNREEIAAKKEAGVLQGAAHCPLRGSGRAGARRAVADRALCQNAARPGAQARKVRAVSSIGAASVFDGHLRAGAASGRAQGWN